MRALGRVDKEARKEAVGVLRDESRRMQAITHGKLSARPGGGTYPRRKGMIGRFANSKGAGLTLRASRYPWAIRAEYGADAGWTPLRSGGIRRHKSVAGWRRRQFPVFKGYQFVAGSAAGPGWIIQPTIREQLPQTVKNLERGLTRVFTESMSMEGVGRG